MLLATKAALELSKKLSGDTASSLDLVLDILKRSPDYRYFILLQPTSPLRTSIDIINALKLMQKSRAKACMSVSRVDVKPNWLLGLDDLGRINPLFDLEKMVLRRQDMSPAFVPNGAIYIASSEWFLKTKHFFSEEVVGYEMPKSKSIDIDTYQDMALCETILKGGCAA